MRKSSQAFNTEDTLSLLDLRFKAHPWHGINIGEEAPDTITAFIEIVPTDTVKYEVDKSTGYLCVDRPQKYSNVVPALYGFIPQTYCGPKVAELSNARMYRDDIVGDGDPLDICVLTEKDISHGDIIMKVRPIGGLRLIDGGEADDKLIAVLDNDSVYGEFSDIDQLPFLVLERIRHYFTTYKDIPGNPERRCMLAATYGVTEAKDVIKRAMLDYNKLFDESSKTTSATPSAAKKRSSGVNQNQ
ncbi:MAG: inorganic pyrophosphatase [Dysgonamonadaceae bacterium]